jgi:hypothetical protein
MANQMAAGIKGTMDSLVKRVKKLEDKHASDKAMEKSNEKLEVIMKANNLKRSTG